MDSGDTLRIRGGGMRMEFGGAATFVSRLKIARREN